MKHFNSSTAARLALLFLVGALVVGLAWPVAGMAQDKTADSAKHKHVDKSASSDKDLAAQVRELQAKIVKLEAALKQGHKGTPSGAADTSGMGMGSKKMGKGGMGGTMDMDMMGGMGGKKKGKGGMGMMDMMMGGMGGDKKGMSGGMGMMDMDMQEMMGMMGMGSMGQGGMKGMGKMKMAAALPGFPGASHIYHIGATGFFLDHPDHIKLATKQQTTLNGLKEKALLEKSTSQRKIDEAEQELWTLTASDQPDATKIEAKVREIEKLRGNQRLAFIRAVGDAAKVLTDEQRKALLGTADKPGAHTGH